MNATAHTPVDFDPDRRCVDPDLKLAIGNLVGFLEQQEDRRRRRTEQEKADHRLAVEAVACNLIAAEKIAAGTAIRVERGHRAVFGGGRYGSPVHGRSFLAVLDTMASAKLIVQDTGFRVSARLHKPSTIHATPALWDHLPLRKVDWSALARDDRREVLILKGEKDARGNAPTVDYEDTPATRRLRRQVQKLNAYLADAPITVLATVDSRGNPIDPTRRTLTRVFNNSSWEEGGRLGNGGFWTNMSRVDRFKLIRLNGERIASADYAQCQPRILFALEGAEQPEGDLYDILGDGRWRKGWQQLLMACLYARQPLRNWPRDCRELFGPNPPRLPDAISELEARLPKRVAFHVAAGTAIGHRLAKVEGNMTLAAIEMLLKQGIPALPVYDCVYVPRRHAKAAREAMLAAAERHAGIKWPGFVKIDLGK